MGFTKRNKKKNETKRNFTFDEIKRNETKFRCFYCFAKQAKFRETKNRMRNGNPIPYKPLLIMHTDEQILQKAFFQD
jgi:hypothetical protein